ncbi:Uma2 family endonuclease [Spirosoma areae]
MFCDEAGRFFVIFEEKQTNPMAALDLEQLLDAPNLPQLLRQAEAALRLEARRRDDFYAWLRDDVKAEFINGHIVMHSPVKERHWAAVGNIHRLLSSYAIKHKVGRVASEKALIALLRNDYDRTADAAGYLLLEAGKGKSVHG